MNQESIVPPETRLARGGKNINEALSWGTMKLKKNSLSPKLDSEVLLSHVLKCSKEFLHSNPDKTLTSVHNSKFLTLIHQRAKHCPVAYLTDKKEFYGLEFKVTPDVLIPRPETELLVELTLSAISDQQLAINNIIDVGTGSGNIIISIAKNITNDINLIATDISEQALKIAKQNAEEHKVKNKITFMQGDLLQPVIENCKLKTGNSANILLANLPYVSSKWKNRPSPETAGLKYEPSKALYAKNNGLYHINKLLKQISMLPKRPKLLFLEFDPRQKNQLQTQIRTILPKAKTKLHKDLSGKVRVCEIELI